MNALPQISVAELKVMKTVWKSAPASTNVSNGMEPENNPDTDESLGNDKLSDTDINVLRSLLSERPKKGGAHRIIV